MLVLVYTLQISPGRTSTFGEGTWTRFVLRLYIWGYDKTYIPIPLIGKRFIQNMLMPGNPSSLPFEPNYHSLVAPQVN